MEAIVTSASGEVSELVRLQQENQYLRQRLAEVTATLERMDRIQQEVMALLNAPSPSRIVHDLRNVLNNLQLLNALVEQDGDAAA